MENISYQPCSQDPPLLIRVPGEENERALGTRLVHSFEEYDIKRSVRNIETSSYIF